MGLNFRKSITILPGVKLNFSKGGASVSAGVPGFRKSINTKGQVRTTASIPGTGIYYTDTKKIGGSKSKSKKAAEEEPKKKTAKKSETKQEQPKAVPQTPANNIPAYQPPQTPANNVPAYQPAQTQPNAAPAYQPYRQQNASAAVPDYQSPAVTAAAPSAQLRQVDESTLKTIHKTADDTIDWDEILASPTAPDPSYNQEMWSYYHSLAPMVTSGDIDAYLKLIYEVNPLDDLIEYGTNFEFGTDDPSKIEVEYTVNGDLLTNALHTLDSAAYNDLLKDFVCSLSIRIARDMFALLPVKNTVVYAVLNSKTFLSVDFDRETLSKVKFGMIDPSDTVERFRYFYHR